MKKEFYQFSLPNLERALLKLGYEEVYSKRLSPISQYKGEWRRNSFHVILESRGRKLTLKIHEDLPATVGHRTVHRGEKIKRELHKIISAYKMTRRVSAHTKLYPKRLRRALGSKDGRSHKRDKAPNSLGDG